MDRRGHKSKTRQITVMLDRGEDDTLRRAAELDQRRVSAYIRRVALAQAAKDLGDVNEPR